MHGYAWTPNHSTHVLVCGQACVLVYLSLSTCSVIIFRDVLLQRARDFYQQALRIMFSILSSPSLAVTNSNIYDYILHSNQLGCLVSQVLGTLPFVAAGKEVRAAKSLASVTRSRTLT